MVISHLMPNLSRNGLFAVTAFLLSTAAWQSLPIPVMCSENISWMSSNRLSLNSAKTQLIWFGTPQQLLKLDHALLSDRFPHFTFQTTVRDLGVTLDSALTFSHHISNLTRSSYFQLSRLRTIRKAVSVSIFTSIVHAFVCSRIDYCNSPLVGLPMTRLSPLQTVLNAAARLIARLPRYSYISSRSSYTEA